MSRFTVTRAALLAWCVAGCGGFLGLVGDDEDAETPAPPASFDGSADGRGDEGGSDVPPGDAGKNEIGTSSDAAKDAKLDVGPDAPSTQNSFRYVFVTSDDFDGAFGVANADAICKSRGDASQIAALNGRSWHAWISTTTPAQDAEKRIEGDPTIPFRLSDKIVIANDLADLTNGSLAHGINRDENGNELGDVPVWTATSSTGTYVNSDCNNWAAIPSQAIAGRVGSTTSLSAGWTDNADRGCSSKSRLYCFEY